MRPAWFLALLAVSACGAARSEAAHEVDAREVDARRAGRIRVAIFADMPYHTPADTNGAAVMAGYRAVLDTIAAEPLAFVVHLGDLTMTTCTDSVYAQRVRELEALPHPVFYTPGDNEWTDCAPSGASPVERLAKLRELFTRGSTSLGRRTLPLERQSADARYATFRENVRWTAGGVTFVSLHVTGSNNNRGRDTTSAPGEYVERNAANLAWLRDAFAAAERAGSLGVGIFMHANPRLDAPGNRHTRRPKPDGFADLLDELERLAVAFRKPVALVHGDTHYFRVDQPFSDATTRRTITNITRAETFGSPDLHGLLMTVDAGSPNLFRFEPLIVPRNARR
jgi:hypothetical protein